MNWFYLIGALMILGGLAVLAPSLLRQQKKGAAASSDNLLLARERLREMENERSRGEISAEAFAQAKIELEAVLAEDLAAEGAAAKMDDGRWGPLGLALVALLVPLLGIGLYLTLGAPQHLELAGPGAGAGQAQGQGQGHQAGNMSVEEMLVRLQQRLQQQPDDVEGWFMLGRTYNALGRHQEAAEVLEKLLPMTNNHPAVLVGLADALAMTQDGRVDGRPYQLVLQALEVEPDNLTALWLAGQGAVEQGDLQNALYFWRRAEGELGERPELLAELQGRIAELLTAAQQQGTALDDPGPVAVAAGRVVAVRIEIASELADQLAPGDQLFVFVKGSDSPMPLAAIKRAASGFPMDLQLDDSAMLRPGMKLAEFAEIRVGARISKSGQPMAASGDLTSSEIVVTADQTQIGLRIDQRIP